MFKPSVRLKLEPDCDFYLSNVYKNVNYLVVRRVSWHDYLLALQPDLIVSGQADSPSCRALVVYGGLGYV
jgi:hypothetical protein